MKNTAFILSITILCFSCTGSNIKPKDFIIIPLAQSIQESGSKKEMKNFVKEVRIITLETSDSVLIGDGSFHFISDEYIILTDDETVYFFSTLDGHFIHKFNHVGNGPGEYISINSLTYDPLQQKIYIHDLNKRTINVYSPQGKSLAQFVNDSVAYVNSNNEGQFIVSYFPSRKWHYKVGIFDAHWQPVASFIENDIPEHRVINLFEINTVQQFNGESYIYITDTLYQISTKGALPKLVLDKGSLRLNDDVASDIRRENEREKSIWGEYGYWAGDLYFLFFVYNRAAYFDVWNTSSSQLIFRNSITTLEETQGMPIHYEGKLIYVWPKFVCNNCIYCFLEPDQASIIYPNYDENNNPLILEIVLDIDN